MKKKLFVIPIVLVALALGVAVAATHAVSAHNDDHSSDDRTSDIVGVWEVDAIAPYVKHLFTFHEDGTMTTTNPTNVQEDPTKPHGGTNDSLGMGVWKTEKKGNDRYIIGTFEQLNAFADNHKEAPKLSVSFKVRLADNGDTFAGPAKARVGTNVDNSGLKGTRLKIDKTTVDQLHF